MVVAALMETKKGVKVIEQMGHFVHIYSGVHKSRITRKGAAARFPQGYRT